MDKLITVTPILIMLINIIYFILSTISLTTSTEIYTSECFSLWGNILVADIFSIIMMVVCVVGIVGLYIKKPNGTDKYDTGVLIVQLIFLIPCLAWTIYTYTNTTDKCTNYATIWTFLKFSIVYNIVFVTVSFILILDKNLYCCVITDKYNIDLKKIACIIIHRAPTGLLDEEFGNFEPLSVNESDRL